MTRFNLGALPSVPDERDYSVCVIPRMFPVEYILDMRKNYDQEHGTCVAQSSRGIFREHFGVEFGTAFLYGGGASDTSGSTAGTGQGTTTRPFASQDMLPVAGAGGGTSSTTGKKGGNGGSDGGNGGIVTSATRAGGDGGYTGGAGGTPALYLSVTNGSDGPLVAENATILAGSGGGFGYGGGCGGGLVTSTAGSSAPGTQGAVMLRIAV